MGEALLKEDEITAPQGVAQEEPPFPDCGHKDWQLGCPRCFWEVEQIAKDKLRYHAYQDQVEGAMLWNWHVIMVISNVEAQCSELLATALDLNVIQSARDVQANLKAITVNLLQTAASPTLMQVAMRKAAQVAIEMERRYAVAQARKAEATAAQEKPLVTLK